jgi:acyl-CoA synthetase (NDP forming)
MFAKQGKQISGNRVFLFVTGGGDAIDAIDTLGEDPHAALPPPAGALHVENGKMDLYTDSSNPFDITGQANIRQHILPLLKRLIDSPDYDIIVFGYLAWVYPPEDNDYFIRELAKLSGSTRKPIIVCVKNDSDYCVDIRERIRKAGVPAFRTMEGCMKAVDGLAAIAPRLADPKEAPQKHKQPRGPIRFNPFIPPQDISDPVKFADALIGHMRADGRDNAYETEVHALYRALGIYVRPFTVITNPDNIPELPEGEKTVLKIITVSEHKSKMGGVRIVPRAEAASAIKNLFMVPGAVAVVAIQYAEQAPGTDELIVGVTRSTCGTVATFGAGGTRTDEKFRRAYMPINLSFLPFSADGLINAAPGTDRLSPAVRAAARDAVNKIVAFMKEYAKRGKYTINDFEINPMIYDTEGRLNACDAVLRTSEKSPQNPGGTSALMKNVQRFLDPEKIAVVGATDRDHIAMLIKNLAQAMAPDEMKRRLYLVNPRRAAAGENFDGIPYIAKTPRDADLCIIMLKSDDAAKASAKLIRDGMRVMVITAGFSETEKGEQNEALIKNALKEERGPESILFGSNTMGFATHRLRATFARHPQTGMNLYPDGDVALITQSGTFLAAAMSQLKHTRFKYGICLGNCEQTGPAPFLRYVLENEPGIKTIGMYIEGINNADEADEVLELINRARSEGRRVIIHKGGVTARGMRAAATHTGAGASRFDTFESVYEKAGAEVTKSYEKWLDIMDEAARHASKTGIAVPAAGATVAMGEGGERTSAAAGIDDLIETLGNEPGFEGMHHRLQSGKAATVKKIDRKNPFYAGIHAYKKGHYARALDIFRKLGVHETISMATLIYSADCLMHLERYNEAIEAAMRGLRVVDSLVSGTPGKRDRVKSIFFGVLFHSAAAMGDIEEALDFARQGVQRAPTSPHSYIHLGSALVLVARNEKDLGRAAALITEAEGNAAEAERRLAGWTDRPVNKPRLACAKLRASAGHVRDRILMLALFVGMDAEFSGQLTARPVADDEKIILSERLFMRGANDTELVQVRQALASILGENGHFEILDTRTIRQRVTNAGASKDKLAVVMTPEDVNDAGAWRGVDAKTAVKASVIIVDDKLTGANYLYLTGLIGLARAVMAKDMTRISGYYSLLTGTPISNKALAQLRGEALNTVAFALAAMLRFRPVAPIDAAELEALKIKMEVFLIAA